MGCGIGNNRHLGRSDRVPDAVAVGPKLRRFRWTSIESGALKVEILQLSPHVISLE
jgi:hypothetical protein